MKRTLQFPKVEGWVPFHMPDGELVQIPVVIGILKTPPPEAIPGLLEDPDVVLKYTREALRKCPWQVLEHFPRAWLLQVLPETDMSDDRRAALNFLLQPPSGASLSPPVGDTAKSPTGGD